MIDGPTGSEQSGKDPSVHRGSGRFNDSRVTDEDRRLFQLWRESLTLQDSRYKNKGLALLARQAMIDDRFRYKLVNETETVLNEYRDELGLPNDIHVQFFENTERTLYVVLPPKAGDVSNRPPAMREVLRSRTETLPAFSNDDYNLGDQFVWRDHHDQADPDTRD